MRVDDQKCVSMVREVNEFLKELNMPIINDKNIVRKHLVYKSLHLNTCGVARLTMNLIAPLREFWQPFGYPNNTFDSKPINEAEKNFTKLTPHNSEKDECKIHAFAVSKKTRLKNINKVLMERININSIRNKFDKLTSMMKNNIDILMVSETKLDSSFTNAKFVIVGYAPTLRYDGNCHGGRILLFIRENIPAKILSTKSTNNFEGFFVELNFQKKKCLLWCSYDPHKSNISIHLICFGETLDIKMKQYEKFIIVGDFNSELSESATGTFCDTYHCIIW